MTLAPFRSGACVKAEAATLLTFFDFEVLINLDAFEATLFEVRSFLAILENPFISI